MGLRSFTPLFCHVLILFIYLFYPVLSCVFEILLCRRWKPTVASKIASVLASGLKGQITANVCSDNHKLIEGDGEMGRLRLATTKTIPSCCRPASGEEKCFHLLLNTTLKWSSRTTKLQFGNRKDVNHQDPKSTGFGFLGQFSLCFSWLKNNNISLGRSGLSATPLCSKPPLTKL